MSDGSREDQRREVWGPEQKAGPGMLPKTRFVFHGTTGRIEAGRGVTARAPSCPPVAGQTPICSANLLENPEALGGEDDNTGKVLRG